eukprot:CAMPEP_0202884142 /NCGR_PEP_ID=MMETSP1391-20130828/40469_1 /ASSEMBLY_ACC=CAM_ASM_000867 /TAXON_ID=1034604 /ORGANISM="Chlamydomonas leiostraca, Strain SAG 11-49" /LENGTH=1194 /DNA_ID=CAMNT_0049567281 /DNA_START=1 /DNA_END=3585 /DNA_ORIENTATION=-
MDAAMSMQLALDNLLATQATRDAVIQMGDTLLAAMRKGFTATEQLLVSVAKKTQQGVDMLQDQAKTLQQMMGNMLTLQSRQLYLEGLQVDGTYIILQQGKHLLDQLGTTAIDLRDEIRNGTLQILAKVDDAVQNITGQVLDLKEVVRMGNDLIIKTVESQGEMTRALVRLESQTMQATIVASQYEIMGTVYSMRGGSKKAAQGCRDVAMEVKNNIGKIQDVINRNFDAPPGSSPDQQAAASARALLQGLDTDGDGFVSVAEMWLVMETSMRVSPLGSTMFDSIFLLTGASQGHRRSLRAATIDPLIDVSKFEQLINEVGGITSLLSRRVNEVSSAAKDAVDGLSKGVITRDLVESLKLPKTWDTNKDGQLSLADAIGAIKELGLLDDTATSIVDQFLQLPGLLDGVSFNDLSELIADIVPEVNGIGSFIATSIAQPAYELAEDSIGLLLQEMPVLGSVLGCLGGECLEGLSELFPDGLLDGVLDGLGELAESLNLDDLLGEGLDALTDLASDAFNEIDDFIGGNWGSAFGMVENIVEGDVLGAIADGIGLFGSMLMSWAWLGHRRHLLAHNNNHHSVEVQGVLDHLTTTKLFLSLEQLDYHHAVGAHRMLQQTNHTASSTAANLVAKLEGAAKDLKSAVQLHQDVTILTAVAARSSQNQPLSEHMLTLSSHKWAASAMGRIVSVGDSLDKYLDKAAGPDGLLMQAVGSASEQVVRESITQTREFMVAAHAMAATAQQAQALNSSASVTEAAANKVAVVDYGGTCDVVDLATIFKTGTLDVARMKSFLNQVYLPYLEQQKASTVLLFLQTLHRFAVQYRFDTFRDIMPTLVRPNMVLGSVELKTMRQQWEADYMDWQSVQLGNEQSATMALEFTRAKPAHARAFDELISVGAVNLQVDVPDSSGFYNVRVRDARAFVFPAASSVTEVHLRLTHGPSSSFFPSQSAALEGSPVTFSHIRLRSKLMSYVRETCTSITSGTPVSGGAMSDSKYIRYSPYGTWLLEVIDQPGSIFANASTIRLEFDVAFYAVSGGSRLRPMFAGQDQVAFSSKPGGSMCTSATPFNGTSSTAAIQAALGQEKQPTLVLTGSFTWITTLRPDALSAAMKQWLEQGISNAVQAYGVASDEVSIVSANSTTSASDGKARLKIGFTLTDVHELIANLIRSKLNNLAAQQRSKLAADFKREFGIDIQFDGAPAI